MKRSKKLLLMLIGLAVIIAACILVVNLVPKETEVSETEEESTVILTASEDSIKTLSWNMDEDTISFEHGDDGWTYAEDSVFPTDSEILETMADAVSEVTSSKTIENPADLSEYGLEEPWKTVSVILSDGEEDSEVTLNFGDTTSLSGEMYCSLGDGNVYLVDSSVAESFEYELLDVVKKEAVPAMDNVESLSVSSESQALDIEYHEGEGLAYSDDYVWFEKDKTLTELDTELTESYIDNIRNLAFGECVEYNADEEALALYGLSVPDVSASVCYVSSVEIETNETDDDGNPVYTTTEQENEFAILLGKDDDGNCYVMIDGSSMVYAADDDLYDALAFTTSIDLKPDEALLMDWDEVNAIDITIDGETFALEKVTREVVEEETEEAEDAEEADETADEESDETEETADEAADEAESSEESETEDEAAEPVYETVWLLGDEVVYLEGALDMILSLETEGYANGTEPEHNEEVSFVIYRSENEAYPETELILYGYNSASCLAVLNGESTVFVSREDCLSLTEELKALLVY